MYKVFPSVTPNDLIVKSTCCGNEIHQSCYIDKRKLLKKYSQHVVRHAKESLIL